jgi:hypothetical protein
MHGKAADYFVTAHRPINIHNQELSVDVYERRDGCYGYRFSAFWLKVRCG